MWSCCKVARNLEPALGVTICLWPSGPLEDAQLQPLRCGWTSWRAGPEGGGGGSTVGELSETDETQCTPMGDTGRWLRTEEAVMWTALSAEVVSCPLVPKHTLLLKNNNRV